MADTKQPIERPRRRKGGSVTLHDVALRAGVHPMTVSNALKGTGRMTDVTRDTIRRIASELNYKPNLSARALVTGRTGSIAVMTGPVSEHFYAHILQLLEEELAASQTQLVWMRSRSPEKELAFLLQSGFVDGVIVIDAVDELHKLAQSRSSILPCVYAGVHHPELASSMGVDNISIDLGVGVREAIHALIASGSQRVSYLIYDKGMERADEVRYRTYLDTMKEVGRPADIINLNLSADTSHREWVRSRLVEHIQQHGAPDGLLCQNDEMAIATYRALLDLGLRIPDDVRLVGCDGLIDMDYFDPPISTIVQPSEEMCSLAWQFLQRRLNDPSLPIQQAMLSAKLKVTPSLHPPATH